MDVSIIIVNYNTKVLTKNCIDSIFEKTSGITFEVILVDNASTDGSVEVLANDDRIKLIKSPVNLGFGKANNLGCQYAEGKYLFLLNSDTKLLNNAIREFFDFAEAHQEEKIGAIGCLLKKEDGSYCHSYAPFPSICEEVLKPIVLPLSRMVGKPRRYLDRPSFRAPYMFVGYVTGADLFVNKSLIDQYGAFDPDFFMYYEETEMQHRWAKEGYVSCIISTPQIVHLEGGSSLSRENVGRNVKKELMTYKSLFVYIKKTASLIEYLLFRCCIALAKIPFMFFSSLNWKDRMAYVSLFLRVEIF